MTLERAMIDALPTVEAELSYLVPMTERPRNFAYEPPAGVPWSNTSHEPRRLPIHDARPIAADVSLDGEGFGIVRQRSAVRDFQDDDEIRRVYYPESIELLKQATGADRVFIFDHTVRRHIPGAADRREAVAAARALRACRPHREIGAAAGSRSDSRGRRDAAARSRPGDQPVAADHRTGAGRAAGGGRRP